MDPLQILLVIVILSLTSLLVVVGVQIFLVVREARIVVRRVNSLLDNPTEKVTAFLESFKKKKS